MTVPSPRSVRSNRRSTLLGLEGSPSCLLLLLLVMVILVGSVSRWNQGQRQHQYQASMAPPTPLRLAAAEQQPTTTTEIAEAINDDNDNYYLHAQQFIDLWPDDNHSVTYRKSLPSCIPEYDAANKCPVVAPANRQRIALVHPPGRLGDLFVEFVTNVVHLHSKNNHKDNNNGESERTSTISDGGDVELVPINHILPGDQESYSKIVRFATLPVLLEATDLALKAQQEILDHTQLTTTTSTPPANAMISTNDLMDITRQLVRWQCQYSQMANHTALLTVTLDRMLVYPSITTRKLQNFLGLTPNETPKENRIEILDDMSLIVMDVIDAGSALVNHVVQNSLTTTSSTTRAVSSNSRRTLSFDHIINNVVEEELETAKLLGACQSVHSVKGSAITSLVGKWLSQ